MFKKIPLRTWATPLTISSFFLTSATGVLMFFELDRGIIPGVHEWFSWLFLVGAAGHTVVHIRAFKNHLRSHWGWASAATFTLVLAASFFSWGMTTGHRLQRPVEQALIDAPMSTLASLTHTTPDAVVRRLKAHGIIATGQQSVRELSGKFGVSEIRLLGIVFLPN